MAGKSNKGKNKKGSHNKASNSSEPVVSPEAPITEALIAPDSPKVEANGVEIVEESSVVTVAHDVENADSATQAKQGDLHLFPVPVRTQGGEKLDLQLNLGDSVMDVRQFLLDAPETCFFTCYDLLLHTKDGSVHHLEKHNEISEVADITAGGCSLEMVAAWLIWQQILFMLVSILCSCCQHVHCFLKHGLKFLDHLRNTSLSSSRNLLQKQLFYLVKEKS